MTTWDAEQDTMDVGTIGLFYVAPLVLWLIFLAVVARVFTGGTLEDSFAYLVILKRRRVEFVVFLVVLGASQIAKDSVQVAWALGSLGEGAMLVSAIVFNIVSAGAIVGLAYTLLRKASLTPAEDRVLSRAAEAMYAVGRPPEHANVRPTGEVWESTSDTTLPSPYPEIGRQPRD